MLKIAVLAFVIGFAAAHTDSKWTVFKATYEKSYRGDEEIYRQYIWQSNLKTIEEHNMLYAQGLKNYFLGENEFTDMTSDEFRRQMNCMNVTVDPGQFESGKYKVVLPRSVNWITKGYTTSVKNQGNYCKSCYAFSAAGSLEGQHFKARGKLVSLSASNLVDCSTKFGNLGCAGGRMDYAFKYIISNQGIDTEQSYPYVPQNQKCNFTWRNVGAQMSTYVHC